MDKYVMTPKQLKEYGANSSLMALGYHLNPN